MEITGLSLILIALVVLLIAGVFAFWRGVEKTEPWAKYFQGVITSTAILLAGYLYFVERKDKPHADVTQTVQAVGLGNDTVAIEAYVVVKNLGTQLLTINRVVSRLQLMDIAPLGVENLPRLKGRSYWEAKAKSGRAAFKGPELRWRQLRRYDDRVKHEIEPGESDLLTISFVFRCPRARHVRIATEIAKPGTGTEDKDEEAKRAETQPTPTTAGDSATGLRQAQRQKQTEPELFWKARTTVDLQPICAPKDNGGNEGEGKVQPTISE